MSVLDRMHRQTDKPLTQDSKGSESTALVAVDPIIVRLRFVTDKILSRSKGSGGSLGRLDYVFKGMMDELLEELNEYPSEVLAEYLSYAGAMVIWLATGDTRALIPGVREFIEDALGVSFTDDQSPEKVLAALTAGSDG